TPRPRLHRSAFALVILLTACRKSSPIPGKDAGPSWRGTLAVVEHADPCPVGAALVSVEGSTISLDDMVAGSTAGAEAAQKPRAVDELYQALRRRRALLDGGPPIAIVRIDRDARAYVAKSILYSSARAGHVTHFAVKDTAGASGCLP